MADKITIRTPQTTDGTNLAYDENEKVIYKETEVPASARKHFESLNASLPEHLRHKIIEKKTEKAEKEPAAPATGSKKTADK